MGHIPGKGLVTRERLRREELESQQKLSRGAGNLTGSTAERRIRGVGHRERNRKRCGGRIKGSRLRIKGAGAQDHESRA